MKIKNWIYLIENNQYFESAEDKLRINFAISGLRGDALTLVRSSDWAAVRQVLEDRYGKEMVLRQDKIETLKIGSNFREFTIKFEQLCHRLNNMLTEKEMIFIFVTQLKSKTQNEVRQRGPHTLKEAVKIALNLKKQCLA